MPSTTARHPAEHSFPPSARVPKRAGGPHRRVVRFAGIVVGILLVFNGLVDATWLHLTGGAGLAWCLGFALLTLSFIPSVVLGFRFQHPLLKVLAVPSSIALGFLSFASIAALAAWITVGAASLFGIPFNPRLLAEVVFGAALFAAAGGVANAGRLRTTRITVRLPQLPPAWEGATAALVSDVHLGNIRGAGFARRIVRRLNRLKPAAVFISGDMFDGAVLDLAAATAPWRQLAAPAGAYLVTGNHDEFTHRAAGLAALRHAGLRVLDNERVVVRGLQILGVHDHEAAAPELFQEILRTSGLERGRASVLLAHQPANLAIPEAAGISLQLSGHTHSGQFWPWNWVVSRVWGPFAYGLNRFGRMQVLTSSGAGTWGPPLRVGTRSEVVLIRFESGDDR